VVLSAPDGTAIGKISWQASRPGGRLLIDAAPLLILVILIALDALFAGMVRIRRLFVDLVDHEAALDVSRHEAEAANLAKGRFLANMSHELRTPLNGIIAMSEMLHQQQTDAKGREMTRTVVASGRILERVLNDILDVSKIEAIEVEFERVPFDMDTLLLDVAALHRATAEAKGLRMELNITPGAAGTYVGDHVRVSQVISNLLSNAVKFTDKGRVAITARPCSTGLHLVVSDTGQGFDRATSDRLFKRFEQGDSSINRRHGGTGLGLWISRALVRAMGGTIRVRSIVGKGTLFSVQLPLERSQPQAPSSLAAEPEGQDHHEDGWPPLRVLVAEDHEVNQRVMMMILDTIGAKVTLAENGALAVEAFKDSDFDVILMDIQMPIMDGLVAMAKIRELEIASGASRTPIIAVTANAMAADREASMKAGADDHLSKPVRPAALIEALSKRLVAANIQAIH
jgi:signal transduction histidine kinase/ActR/RegA family two-component response regulator